MIGWRPFCGAFLSACLCLSAKDSLAAVFCRCLRLQGSLQPPPMPRAGYGEGRGAGRGGFPDPAYAAAAAAGPFGPFGASGRGAGRSGGYWGPEAYMGYYPMPGPAGAYYPPAAAAAAPMYPRGRGGFFPGGKNWAGARPPPPGQPGFSSGLQVRLGSGVALQTCQGGRLCGVLERLQRLPSCCAWCIPGCCCTCAVAASMRARQP